MGRISIAFVLPNFAGGGAERVALTLLAGLDRSRFNPSLVVFSDKGPLRDLVAPDLPITSLGRDRLRSALVPMVRHFRKNPADIIFSTLGYVNLGILASGRLIPRKTRTVVREANLPSISLAEQRHPKLMKLLYRRLYPSADAIIVTSCRMASELGQDFAIPENLIRVLPNPVDAERLRAAAAVTLRHPGTGLRLVAAGRLRHQKGFDRLLQMIPSIPADAHVTVLGDGPDRPILEASADAAGLLDRVKFLGFVTNPYPWYAGADAFLMPSRWEGLPNAVLESLACGTPAIATPESGGIDEIRTAAARGAVIIADAGPTFVEAINGVKPRTDKSLRQCLLPDRFQAPNAIWDFQNVLDDLARVT